MDTVSPSFLPISMWSFCVQQLVNQPSGLLQEELLYMQVQIRCVCRGSELTVFLGGHLALPPKSGRFLAIVSPNILSAPFSLSCPFGTPMMWMGVDVHVPDGVSQVSQDLFTFRHFFPFCSSAGNRNELTFKFADSCFSLLKSAVEPLE